ncbi:transcription factor bHLH143-like [Aristolochia californica]|uniref:transcription factor bHLH143-like n=1 Tax=Aristolochia californica TaxID=171875 RepID=UPI0035DE4F1C
MGKDCESWSCQQHSPWQSANVKCTSIPPDLGPEDGHLMAFPAFASPHVSLAELALPKLVGENELRQWYCDYSPQTCTPAKKSIHELFSGSPHTQTAYAGVANVNKGFFVFDQTGNRTSLIFSAVCPPADAYSLQRKDFGIEPSLVKKENPVILNSDEKFGWCGLEETDISAQEKEKSDMREDTAELDALLYSDDENEEEEEEASTGHSPLDISEYHQKKVIHDRDEVGTSTPTKKRRLNETHDDMAEALMDTASSGKLQNGMWLAEDDAESSCIKGPWGGETCSKRVRRERIKETVGVLRSIIPSGKSKRKDAAVVLDDAIRYLGALKLKAKALGLGTALLYS